MAHGTTGLSFTDFSSVKLVGFTCVVVVRGYREIIHSFIHSVIIKF